MTSTRPKVVAHRGASYDNAEHTLRAYTKALEQGADALECDVRLTADGHLVCVHDRDLRRIASHKGVVSAMELATLSELHLAARGPSPGVVNEAADRDPELDGVLTLRRLFETVAAYDRPVELAVETKHPTRYAGLVERRLVDLLQEFDWHEESSPVRVMSFSYLALQRVERLAPELRKVMLFEHARHWPLLRKLVEDHWVSGPWIATLRRHPAFARRLADSGREIHVWTVNSEPELQTCLDLGVHAVITDRPRFVIDLLDHDGPSSG